MRTPPLLIGLLLAGFLLAGPLKAATPGHLHPDYAPVQEQLQQGWNTWNTRSVLSYVLLPQGFAVNLAFKQHYWLDEKYLAEALIGRRGEDDERVRPGLHSYDGYSELELQWETIRVRVEAGRDGYDLVVLLTPLEAPASPAKLIVESAMLWNRPGALSRTDQQLSATWGDERVDVFISGAESVDDPYVPTRTPYLALPLDNMPIGISSGRERTVDEIRGAVQRHRQRLLEEARNVVGDNEDLAEAFQAIRSGIAWNTIYEPKHDRVVSTVGRLWNEEYGGYCLFGWDNFFLAYMTGLESRDLAFANVIEHLHGATEEGFIPNDNAGNGRKSWDHSQPPVGSIMVREVYRQYPEKWFLEATFDALLAWNRWWPEKRLNDGLLSYGSHEAKNPFNEKHRRTMTAAGYESGMDDSPMYEDVPFNPAKNVMELQDVGLVSLYIADARALAEIAAFIDRPQEADELNERAQRFSKALESLWDNEIGFYLNRRTDTGELSHRLSPTLFYPLLAEVPDPERARRIVDHLLNPEIFAGDYMIPSIARNDPAFERQRYWKGAIWPPLNFLTYLALRQAGMTAEHGMLAEKSLDLFVKEWRRMGYVSENYSAITGTGDDPRLSSDRFHSWGALMGMIPMIEAGHTGRPEDPLPQPGGEKDGQP